MPEQHALPELKQTLKRLAANRTFVILLIAACAVSMGTFGRALWEPTFLRRIYDMSPAQAGAWYFLIGPVPAAVGAVISGYLLDRFAQRDARWYGWLYQVDKQTGTRAGRNEHDNCRKEEYHHHDLVEEMLLTFASEFSICIFAN